MNTFSQASRAATEAKGWAPEEFVDLKRYPVLDLDSPQARRFIAWGRRRLATDGICELDEFVAPAHLSRLLEDARRLAPRAHRTVGEETAYDPDPDLAFPPGHPRRHLMRYSLAVLPYDRFPASSPMRRLYEWAPFRRFVARLLEVGKLYSYADKLGALNISFMGVGDELQWHFDEHDFVVTLALQSAGKGGDFEVFPNTRSAEDERYSKVESVLNGRDPGIKRLAMRPGTLLLFKGRHSVHRVTPIEADPRRIVGILCFDTQPGVEGKVTQRLTRYGRNE